MLLSHLAWFQVKVWLDYIFTLLFFLSFVLFVISIFTFPNTTENRRASSLSLLYLEELNRLCPGQQILKALGYMTSRSPGLLTHIKMCGLFFFFWSHPWLHCKSIACVYCARCDMAHVSFCNMEIDCFSLFRVDPSFICETDKRGFAVRQQLQAEREWLVPQRCCDREQMLTVNA